MRYLKILVIVQAQIPAVESIVCRYCSPSRGGSFECLGLMRRASLPGCSMPLLKRDAGMVENQAVAQNWMREKRPVQAGERQQGERLGCAWAQPKRLPVREPVLLGSMALLVRGGHRRRVCLD